MTVKQSFVGLLLIATLASAVVAILFLTGHGLPWQGTGEAMAQTRPETKTVVLAKDQKLKDANWHCYAGGYCELWTLTKPRKAEDKPESYVFQNADGSRTYVIKEQ
jgi:hypothetical protein